MVYLVDSAAMIAQGHLFFLFLSQNGVWLTKSVPIEYLSMGLTGVAPSSRATGRVGQTHRALPGKEILLRATASTQGRLRGTGIGFVIAFGVIGNTKTQVVDVLELHGLYYVINR